MQPPCMHPAVAQYAELLAVHSDCAALAFAVAHFLLLIRHALLFTRRRDTTVYFLMTCFALSRCTIFTLRLAPLYELQTLRAHSIIILNTGTSCVLHAAYSLVLQRDATTRPYSRALATRLRRSRTLVTATLLYCVFLRFRNALSISYSYWLMHQLDRAHKPVRKADVPLYLIVSSLLVLQTLVLALNERTRSKDHPFPTRKLLTTAAIALLLFARSLVSALLVGIEGPSAAHNTAAQETLYLLCVAVPEFLVSALFGVGGLLPSQAEMRVYQLEEEGEEGA